jgi:hypothetical protein
VYQIPSNAFNGKKDRYIFRSGDIGLDYYYNENLEILKLERLHRDYIARSPKSKENGNNQPALLSLSSLPDLAESFSPDEEYNVCGPPRIGCFCDKDKNLDKEAVSSKREHLHLLINQR